MSMNPRPAAVVTLMRMEVSHNARTYGGRNAGTRHKNAGGYGRLESGKNI